MHCNFLVFLLIVFFFFLFSRALVNFDSSKEWALMANKIQILLLLLLYNTVGDEHTFVVSGC